MFLCDSIDSFRFPTYLFFINHFKQLGPEPAFGRLGLGGSSGGYSSHGYTSHASIRAYGAQLGGDSCSSEDLQNIVVNIDWIVLTLFIESRPRAGLRPAGPRWIVGREQFSWVHFSRLASRLRRSARRGQLFFGSFFKCVFL